MEAQRAVFLSRGRSLKAEGSYNSAFQSFWHRSPSQRSLSKAAIKNALANIFVFPKKTEKTKKLNSRICTLMDLLLLETLELDPPEN